MSHYITGKADGPIALTITTVDTRETVIQNGTVETVLATCSITPARAKKVAFAGPCYRFGDAIMVKSDNTSISSVGDLNGNKIVTQQVRPRPIGSRLTPPTPTSACSPTPPSASRCSRPAESTPT